MGNPRPHHHRGTSGWWQLVTIELKGATVPCTSVNGHMFSFRTSAALALGLPTEARDAFLETYDTRLCESHGQVMKEYVEVLLRCSSAPLSWSPTSA